MDKTREILRYLALGMSQVDIASLLKVSRNTIRKTKIAAEQINLTWEEAGKMENNELEKVLFPKQPADESLQPKPDFEYVAKELQRPGVTRQLLWEEYVEEAKAAGKIPLQYSQFCNLVNKYLEMNKATMHFEHNPAERIEVDWAGTTIPIYDLNTGEVKKSYLFVATLPYSQYSYAEVMEDMKEHSWITAHIHMLEFFGGTTAMIIPDNLKTGVIKHSKHDIILNEAYREFSDYYDIAIVPALPRTPKGKPSVEATVGKLTTHIIAKMRNETFYSVYEANERARQLLDEFNSKAFQKREGSRIDVFLHEEQPLMRPLPRVAYEYAEWKQATVKFNYHISVDKMNYSVPYEYIGYKVEVRITRNLIEIYYKDRRICSHKRIHGRPGQYSTNDDHMPENHKKVGEWNGDRFRRWARSIGKSTYQVIDNLLKNARAEQQAYEGCRSVLKLADSYSERQLEEACTKALEHLSLPRYKNIKLIIQHNQAERVKEMKISEDNSYAIVRGADYYGGHSNE